MKRFAPLALAAITLGVAACSNDAPPVPTSPLTVPSHTVVISGGDPCSIVLHEASAEERRALFSEPVLGEIVTDYWNDVDNNCPMGGIPTDVQLATAREAMLAYVQHTIDLLMANPTKVNQPVDNVPPGKHYLTREEALVDHWNTMFAFVGLERPELPKEVLLPGVGIAGVIFQNTPGRELKIDAKAAMTVPVQGPDGDTKGHLFTIYPLSPGCLSGSNLVQSGPCFQFSANPKVDPKFDPKIIEGICEPTDGENPIAGVTPALGHLDDNLTKVAGAVSGPYPTGCIDGPLVALGSWSGGVSDIARRLAWLTSQALGVKSLYAAHGGLGGVSEELSPFSALETTVFKATFTSAPDAPPGPPDVGLAWTQILSRQSSVTVQKSLGDLVSSPVVLNQGGGNCAICGGLELRGTVKGAGALLPATGRYLVSWRSLQSKPSTKDAPFVLRASNGAEIARVSYASKAGKDQLLYNGIAVGSWTKGKQQKFEITVDFTNHVTALSIDGVVVAQNKSFTAPNLASIAAEFSGIDAGIMGWDDITIVALADP